MSTFFDENGNPVTTDNETNTPSIPEQPPRKIELSIKDKNSENYAKVGSDGSLEVKVTDLPPIEISTGDITISNTVEIKNDIGNPIPVSGNVNATVSGTVDVNSILNPVEIYGSITFPEVQEVEGTINVGNFPTTQAVSIAETVEVSFADEQVVTISNPTTDVSVNNFPATTEVNNMVSAIDIGEATNEYINKQYTIYSNNASFYADAMPPSVDPFGRNGMHYLNNYANGATVGQKKINWYFYDPTRQTSTYGNLQGAWALVTIDRNTNRYPFFYVFGTTNGTTISSAWTFYTDLNNLIAGKTYLFYLGQEPTVYPDVPRVQMAYAPQVSYGTRNPNEFVYSIALTTDSANESGSLEMQVYELGYKVNNNPSSVKLEMLNVSSGSVEITNDIGNPIPISGSVDIATMPPIEISSVDANITNTNLNVTVSNPTSEVSVSNFPTEITVSNPVTEVSVSNQPTTIAVSNHPTSINVGNFPTSTAITGTVEISNDEGNPIPITFSGSPTVEISNEFGNPITVTLSNIVPNQTNPLYVSTFNPMEVNVSNEVTVKAGLSPLQVDGSVFVTNLPTSTEISNDSGNPVPVSGTVGVNNFPFTQNVSFNNISQPVSIQGTPTINANINGVPTISGTVEITNDVGNPIPVNGTVNINDSTAINVTVSNQPTSIQVSNFPTTQQISGNVEISNDVGNAIPITAPNALNVLAKGYDGSTYHDLKTDNVGRLIVKINDTENTLIVSGNVEISNDAGNPIPVSGNVEISNDSGTPISVSGTVEISNDVGNPIPVSGQVNIGTIPNVTIANPQTSVSVSNFPTTQPISGTVLIDDTSPVDVNITNALTITPPANQDVTITNASPISVNVSTLPSITIANTGFNVTNTPSIVNSNLHNCVTTSGINQTTSASTSYTLLNATSTNILSGVSGYSIIIDKLSIFCDPSISSPTGRTFQLASNNFLYTFVCTSNVNGDVYELPLPVGGLRLVAGGSLSLINENTSATSVGSVFKPVIYFRYV